MGEERHRERRNGDRAHEPNGSGGIVAWRYPSGGRPIMCNQRVGASPIAPYRTDMCE